MNRLQRIRLEMSLKPFYRLDTRSIEDVCETAFSQWRDLLDTAGEAAVLLWAADGSEILEYAGRDGDAFPWADRIGGAVRCTDWDREEDPEGLGLHTTNYPYREGSPAMTYGDLKRIVAAVKRVGRRMTGKPVLVGATFDPGPEFAVSDFKYRRHREICVGESMGRKSMVCCYARLNGEARAYAAYPDGIPDGEPFGLFFGRQADCFLRDLNYDYLWLSNGFGFGTETWGIRGALFDGEAFYPDKLKDVRDRIMEFWRLFRSVCSFRVETRGTNLTTGIDFATDGVDLKTLYAAGLDILPPPNSPWAAMDGDFGLELAGYLSRIAELPEGEAWLFRFYVHDPWWMNSPWLDRYGRQPHDIYLPMALSRIDGNGRVEGPGHAAILSIDDSLGRLPTICPQEVIPHLREALRTAPDAIAPVVLVYPFDEYLSGIRLEKPFFEDSFLCGAITAGLPVSAVLSSRNFHRLLDGELGRLADAVVVCPVPCVSSPLTGDLLRFTAAGGRALLYGSLQGAAPDLLDALGLELREPLSGWLKIEEPEGPPDRLTDAGETAVYYDAVLTDGGIAEAVRGGSGARVLAAACDERGERAAAVSRGRLAWVRGSDVSRVGREPRGYNLSPWMRGCLARWGLSIRYEKPAAAPEPVILLHRHNGALWFSGYCPDTTVDIGLNTPAGAPVLLGQETSLRGGEARYRQPRAWRAECRVLVEQADGVVSCREIPPVSYQYRRRFLVSGLQNATVRVLPETGRIDDTRLLVNGEYPYMVGDPIEVRREPSAYGEVLRADRVTGTLLVSTLWEGGKPVKPENCAMDAP